MSEIYIEINSVDPLDLFGCSEEKLNTIRKYFPELKIILRGDLIMAVGDPTLLNKLEEKMKWILYHYEYANKLSDKDIHDVMCNDIDKNEGSLKEPLPSDVLLSGVHGKQIKAITTNQQALVKASFDKDMVFAIGPAGSGKTYTAVALAVRALKNKEVKKIILTRPAVEAGENLGFLPGDMREKLDPYMQPLFDALKDMIAYQRLLNLIEEGAIEIAPLAFMRGRTLDNAFVILDEAQNATDNQMKMFLTRMGKSAKFIITGDVTQIDLPIKQHSGLLQASHILTDIPEISFVYLTAEDVVRHPIVSKVLKAYEAKKS